MTKVSKATAVTLSTKRLAALRTYVKNGKIDLGINGVSYKLPQLIAVYQGAINTRQAVDTKQAEVKAAMSERASAESLRRAADDALQGWVRGAFGVNSQEAIDFGFAPKTPAPRSPASKVHAAAQAQATREARGTMGKKERLKIKGVVPSPTTTPGPPATAPAAPATNAPAPAPTQAAPVSAPPASAASPPAGGASTPAVNGAPSH